MKWTVEESPFELMGFKQVFCLLLKPIRAQSLGKVGMNKTWHIGLCKDESCHPTTPQQNNLEGDLFSDMGTQTQG